MEHGPLADGASGLTPPADVPPQISSSGILGTDSKPLGTVVLAGVTPEASSDRPRNHTHWGRSGGHPGLGQGGPHVASGGLATISLPSSHTHSPFSRITHFTAPEFRPTIHHPKPWPSQDGTCNGAQPPALPTASLFLSLSSTLSSLQCKNSMAKECMKSNKYASLPDPVSSP